MPTHAPIPLHNGVHVYKLVDIESRGRRLVGSFKFSHHAYSFLAQLQGFEVYDPQMPVETTDIHGNTVKLINCITRTLLLTDGFVAYFAVGDLVVPDTQNTLKGE